MGFLNYETNLVIKVAYILSLALRFFILLVTSVVNDEKIVEKKQWIN